MNVLAEAPTALYPHAADAPSAGTVLNRESLALVLLDRITQAEDVDPQEGVRAYTLELLRDILLTIDGKRNPPITFAGADRRTGGIERRPG